MLRPFVSAIRSANGVVLGIYIPNDTANAYSRIVTKYGVQTQYITGQNPPGLGSADPWVAVINAKTMQVMVTGTSVEFMPAVNQANSD